MGTSINHVDEFENEVFDDANGADAPGLDWSLSNETIELMNAIDRNMRVAEQQSGSILIG